MSVAPSAGAEPDKVTYFGYTAIVNLLDYSAGTFPAGNADRQVDLQGNLEPPLSQEDENIQSTYGMIQH